MSRYNRVPAILVSASTSAAHPMTLSRTQRQTIAWTAVAIALAALLVALGPVLTPFVIAAILAYTLEPGVSWLARRHVPRALGAILMMLCALCAVLVLVLILLPILQQEAAIISEKLPGLLARLTEDALPWLAATTGFEIPLDGASLRGRLADLLATSGDDIASALLGYARTGGNAAIQIIGSALLVPLLLIYLLIDWHLMLERVDELLPRRWHAQTHDILREVDGLLGQYLRGQGLVILALAAVYSIGLLLAGFRLWLPIGVLSGLLVVIPYFGFAIGMLFALVDGLLQFPPGHALAAVGIVYGIGQVLESYYLTPYLVGERIGLHPVVVIFALLAFGSLFGFIGVLLALPLAAIASVGVRRIRGAWLASESYRLPPS